MRERLPAGLSPQAEPSLGSRTIESSLQQALPHQCPGLQTNLSMLAIVSDAAMPFGCKRLYGIRHWCCHIASPCAESACVYTDKVKCLPRPWGMAVPHRTCHRQMVSNDFSSQKLDRWQQADTCILAPLEGAPVCIDGLQDLVPVPVFLCCGRQGAAEGAAALGRAALPAQSALQAGQRPRPPARRRLPAALPSLRHP